MNQKTLNIIFGVVIVALIGAVVYFAVGQKSELTKNQPVATNTVNTVSNPQPTTVSNPQPTNETNPNTTPTAPKPTVIGFETKKEENQMVLYKLMSDGTSVKTGLKVALSNCGQNADGSTFYCPANIVVSPDRTKAVYTMYKNVYQEIWVANIDGTQSKKIAQQEVTEGSGELKVDTLKWSSDSQFVTYQESAVGQFGTLPSGVPDLRPVLITYEVNVATGSGRQISSEVIK